MLHAQLHWKKQVKRPLHSRLSLLKAARVNCSIQSVSTFDVWLDPVMTVYPQIARWSSDCCLHAMSGAATARESTSVRSRLERNQASALDQEPLVKECILNLKSRGTDVRRRRRHHKMKATLILRCIPQLKGTLLSGGGAPLRAASGCEADGRTLGSGL